MLKGRWLEGRRHGKLPLPTQLNIWYPHIFNIHTIFPDLGNNILHRALPDHLNKLFAPHSIFNKEGNRFPTHMAPCMVQGVQEVVVIAGCLFNLWQINLSQVRVHPTAQNVCPSVTLLISPHVHTCLFMAP